MNKTMTDTYKDAEWITIGSGAVRLSVIKASNLNMGLIFYLSKKLAEIENELKFKKD